MAFNNFLLKYHDEITLVSHGGSMKYEMNEVYQKKMALNYVLRNIPVKAELQKISPEHDWFSFVRRIRIDLNEWTVLYINRALK